MRTPSWSQLRQAAVLWGGLLIPLVMDAASGTGPRVAELVGGAALLAILVALCDRAPLAVLCAAVATAMTVEVVLAPTTFSPVRVWPFAAVAVFACVAGRRIPDAQPVPAALAGVAVTGLPVALVVGLVVDDGSRGGFGLLSGVYDWSALMLVLLLAVAPAWLLGRYRRQRAALVAAGWERAALLERQHRLEADQARLAERARIARDMHDSLGHEWTLIALRAAALEVSPQLDDDTRAAARDLRFGVAVATERLRDVIGVLRPDAEGDPGEGRTVTALVERAAAAGMRVQWDAELEPVALPVLVQRAVHRVVQEALTNAARHAPGAEVTVGVEHGQGATTVTVTNGVAGTVPPAARPGARSGLVGLRERVRLLGGTLHAGPAGTGFTVVAVLPHDGGPAGSPPDDLGCESARDLARARGEVRRSVAGAVRVPVLAGTAVTVLALALFLLVGTANRLDPATFERLPTGAARAAVEAELPPFQVLGEPGRALAPPPPNGWCRYYWSSEPTDDRLVFRLCFEGEQLVIKEAVERAALSGSPPEEDVP
ncbi:sensor histidine kinase [Pseudonocardia xinjiangensis]|uniref:histidine kinase n=1 Tax=Pseudonocardia xinjiangensis TaxID=75289 RepID=A0ABX1RMK4_9PSEU|nr:histidine kinase [Pseudonocardia xinjiangensis]NMH80704.1 sensor histidine kinase [Pseudonocardia xinjiangensis]